MNWKKSELMPFVYCNTSKSLLPEKKSQRLLIFIKIRNRCLNRAPDTFDRTTMAGLMGSSFPLSLTGRLQNIKTVRHAGFHYLFQRITLDISNFFPQSLNSVLPFQNGMILLANRSGQKNTLVLAPYGLWADLIAFYVCR